MAPEGRKVGSLKRRVRSQLGQRRDEKLRAVVARSTFPSQNVQNTPFSDHFWKLRCRKSARRCGLKHISKSKCTKHTSSPDHFWKLRCRKSARRCGAKHISKSKITKHTMYGPLLEVQTSKKCTPLWREAHFEVKMLKTPGVRTTFGGSDVAKVHAVVARSTFRSQHVKNTRGSDHFWRFRCRFTTLHYITLHYIPLHSTTLHYTTPPSTTIRHTKLHYIPLHSTTLHYITLNDTAPQIDR